MPMRTDRNCGNLCTLNRYSIPSFSLKGAYVKRSIVLGFIAVLLQIASFSLLGVVQSVERGAERSLLTMTSLLMLGASGVLIG